MNEEPELLDKKRLYKRKAFSVYEYKANVKGEVIKREIIERSHGVVIVPVDTALQVLLIEEYCAGSNSFILSLPGGSIEGEEPIEEAAMRELREETGYKARNLFKLHFTYTHPSTTNRKSHTFLAYDLVEDPLPSSREIIEVIRMPLEEAILRAYMDFQSDVSTIGNLLMAREKLKQIRT